MHRSSGAMTRPAATGPVAPLITGAPEHRKW